MCCHFFKRTFYDVANVELYLILWLLIANVTSRNRKHSRTKELVSNSFHTLRRDSLMAVSILWSRCNFAVATAKWKSAFHSEVGCFHTLNPKKLRSSSKWGTPLNILSVSHNIHVCVTQCTCQYHTIYMSVWHNTHGSVTQYTCQYYTIYMAVSHNIHVSVIQCTCHCHTMYKWVSHN